MEENYSKVVRIFFGTRADLAPYPLAFLWDCQRCHAPTYSAAEPPPDQMPVCNICASELSAIGEQNPTMDVTLDLTAEGKDIVRDIALKKQRPVEEVFNRVIEWKLGRPVKATIYDKSLKKKTNQ